MSPSGCPAPGELRAFATGSLSEAAFERVVKDYGTEIQFGKQTFGTAANSALFELRNLRVGKTVPEVEGEDVDGAKFKLSDYRGKVVMLDFWGHW